MSDTHPPLAASAAKRPPPAMRTLAGWLCILSLAGCAGTPVVPGAPFTRAGTGPTVVFQAGLGDGKEVWASVLPELSRDFTVVALDRAGTGANPPRPGRRSPCDVAAEERTQLQSLGLRPPYILVGHSLGGLYQYAFAKLYPGEVAGLVLVDPTHPRNLEIIEQEMPHALALIKATRTLSWRDAARREFDDQLACLDQLDMDRPLAVPGQVLVAGRPQSVSSPGYEKRRLGLGRDWARLAGLAQVAMVWDCAHYIQKERPGAVAAAVRAVAGAPPVADGSAPARATVRTLRTPPIPVEAGATTSEQVRQAWGEPAERHQDGDLTVWIYTDLSAQVPTLVSLLPVIGDIADGIELAQQAAGRREVILWFDTDGRLKRHSVRMLD